MGMFLLIAAMFLAFALLKSAQRLYVTLALAMLVHPAVYGQGSQIDLPVIFNNPDGGAPVAQMTTDGLELNSQPIALLDSGQNHGTFISTATQATATDSISVTFDTAQPDTNYDILLTTTGMTATYAPVSGAAFTVGDKYTGSFEIRNPAALTPPIGGYWFLFRTARPQ